MMNDGSKKSAIPDVYNDPSLASGDRLIVYHALTREHVEEGLELAEKILKERGVDISDNPFFERIKSEPEYKEQVFNDVLSSVRKETDTRFQKDLKSGARVIKMY